MKKWLEQVELKGELVTLIPLTRAHENALIKAASDGNLWELWYTSVPSSENIDAYINTALEQLDSDSSLPFAIQHNQTGDIIGTTRFCNSDPIRHRVEIGYTWYAKSFQRTGVNTECKYLLLRHAFEHLSAIAVEFRTHWHNLTSRKAIERLGAKQDGVLRNHQQDPDGCYRDTVVFSIINQEWRTVKKSLEFLLKY